MSTNLMRQPQTHAPATRISLAVLGLFVITLGVSCAAAPNQEAGLVPSADFQPIAEIDLSTRPYDEESLGQFTLAETAVVGVVFTLQNLDTPYFDLRLQGPDGDSLLILHSEDYRTDENGGGTWEQNLLPGVYRLVLTAHQSPGILSIYWGYN